MNTNPDVKRFVERAKATTPPNTLAKADEEGDSYKFSNISSGHHACVSGNTVYIIIETGDKIGCSCGDMTYHCHNSDVCKHITTFLKLGVPPQIPAAGELIQKLMVMGWVGGKNDLHPGPQSKPAQNTPDRLASVVCPHCKTRAKRKTQEDADTWLANHLPKCPKNPDNDAQKAAPKPPTQPNHKTRTPRIMIEVNNMNSDQGIDTPDITDELKSAYIRMLAAMGYPCSMISAETGAAFIELSDGRKAQVVIRIDANPDRWCE